MTILFNPIDYPIVFQQPRRLTGQSYWSEHIPFGMLAVALLKPRVLVELGTHYGDSYCAFCEAAQSSALDLRAYAIDNWTGDPHTGEYGPEILAELRSHHDPLYGNFSTLVQSSFAEALEQFNEGEIDLLHIDGTHTYEAVREDFESWAPKMSERGVVLLHDTNVLDRGYGVRQLFDELKETYEHFEFLHGYGLGILAVCAEPPESLKWLFEAREEDAARIRGLFHVLGRMLTLNAGFEEKKEKAKQKILAQEHEQTLNRLKEQEATVARLQSELSERDRQLTALHHQIEAITQSRGWSFLQTLWGVKRGLLGAGVSKDSTTTQAVDEPYYDNSQSMPAYLSRLTEEEWLNVLIQSVDDPSYRGIELPGFPPEEYQKNFVGSSGETALREAHVFYRLIKKQVNRFNRSLTPDSKILDFGCGWGRYTRFFLRDVHEENIFGVDVLPIAIDLCEQSNAKGTYRVIDHLPPIDFASESFDLIYAYSVFSHLSEPAGLEWLEEFSRLLKPNGILIVTTQGRSFIEYCRSLRGHPTNTVWHEFLSRSFVDTEATLADYDHGKFLYAANGGGTPDLPPTLYGEALIPKAYVLREWTKYLSFREFIDDRNVLGQAVIVMQK